MAITKSALRNHVMVGTNDIERAKQFYECTSPGQVQQSHDLAVAHGGTSIEAPPGPRDRPAGAVWLAYVRDPDGNKLCALYRPA